MTHELIRLSETDTEIINVKTHFHFMKYHVFVDHDFLDFTLGLKKIYIREDHRIHIFVSNKSIKSIEDESLMLFVTRCKRLIRKKIIIHIPKCDKHIAERIKNSIGPVWSKICKIFIERDGSCHLFNMTGLSKYKMLNVYSIAFFHKFYVEYVHLVDYPPVGPPLRAIPIPSMEGSGNEE